MRDYIVLWYTPEQGLANGGRWHGEEPSGDVDNFGVNAVQKVYVRIPDKNLLLEFFNQGTDDYSTTYVSQGGFHYPFGEFWGRLFGNDGHIGGYRDLSKMPTSDAYGAINGRPARGRDGRFIRNPY